MTAIADISLDAILATLRALEPKIRTHGVTRLAVFGSRVRGDHRLDSDLDILIESTAYGETPKFDVFEVIYAIERATGLSVHVSMPSELKPRMVERMADDLREVF